jgi:ATP-dependent protease ClpP protease subunit
MENITINLPKNLDNMALPDPFLLNQYQEFEDRIIWLDSSVNEDTVEIGKKILRWNMEDRTKKPKKIKPIVLLIFSYGGNLDVCNSLIDIIEGSDTPVYGVNMGIAASAACFIYLACHKRFMLPRSSFLIHRGSGGYEGTYEQVLAQIVDYQNSIELIVNLVKEKTNYSEKEIEEKIATEWYIRKEEALKYGVTHQVVKNLNEVLTIREDCKNDN